MNARLVNILAFLLFPVSMSCAQDDLTDQQIEYPGLGAPGTLKAMFSVEWSTPSAFRAIPNGPLPQTVGWTVV